MGFITAWHYPLFLLSNQWIIPEDSTEFDYFGEGKAK
jgi:hypothetical protein